jgi:glycine dehydrogenase subunit 1
MGLRGQEDEEGAAMLARAGLASSAELYDFIPEGLRFPDFSLPLPESELEAMDAMGRLARADAESYRSSWFLGAGIYDHFVPAAVSAVAAKGRWDPRGRGTAAGIADFVSLAAALLGMDRVLPPRADGASALAEAVAMVLRDDRGRIRKGRVVMLPAMLHPAYRQVLETLLAPFEPRFIQFSLPPREAAKALPAEIACMVCALPDYTGEYADLAGVAERARGSGGFLIVHVDPVSLGLFKPPGAYKADIAVAEGQGLGLPMAYSGATLGILGLGPRLAGLAGPAMEEGAFSIGRADRAIAAAAQLRCLGAKGLKRQAELCWHKAHYAAARFSGLPGFSVLNAFFFDEFVVRLPYAAERACLALEAARIMPGQPMARFFPERSNDLLVSVTESNSKREIDALVEALRDMP